MIIFRKKLLIDFAQMFVIATLVSHQAECRSQNIDTTNFTNGMGYKINDYTTRLVIGDSSIASTDYNGDGIADCVISNYRNPEYGISVIMGQENPSFTFDVASLTADNTRGFLITHPLQKQSVGHSIASAGDFNADGFSDILIGNPGVPGEAFLVFGRENGWQNFDITTLDTTSSLGFKIIGSPTLGKYTGGCVAGVGDLNGDGFDDIAISRDVTTSLPNTYIFVMFGRAGTVGPVDISTFTSSDTNGFIIFDNDMNSIGLSLAGPMDFNNDGYDDLAFSSDDSQKTESSFATGFILLGKPSGFRDIDFENFPNSIDAGYVLESSQQLTSVAQAGDFNGDGFADLRVGQPLFLYPGGDRGRLVIVPGRADGQTTISLDDGSCWTYRGSADYAIGVRPKSAGDLNSDGYDDIITFSYNSYLEQPRLVYIFYGNDAPPVETSISALGSGNSVGFVMSAPNNTNKPSLAGGGDFDGDGYDDVFVNWFDGSFNSVAYIVSGKSPNNTGVSDWQLYK